MVQELGYLRETPSQTAGPYVHIGLTPNFSEINGVYDADLGIAMVNDKTLGERITVKGRIFDGDNQPIGFLRRGPQVPDVTDMEQIEDAVREPDRASGRAVPGDSLNQIGFAQDQISERRPCGGPSCDQFSSVVSWSLVTASDSSCAATVAVPRFITTSMSSGPSS